MGQTTATTIASSFSDWLLNIFRFNVMDLSFIQDLHSALRHLFPIGRDAQHVFAAFFIVIVTMLMTRRSFSVWWVVMPCFVFTAVVEILDTLEFGPQYWFRNLVDFVIGNAIPVILVVGTRLGWLR